MSNELEVYANYLNKQAKQETKNLEVMGGIIAGIGSLAFGSLVESERSDNNRKIEEERLRNELEIRKQENEVKLAEIDLEKHKITEQKKVLERIINASLMAYNGKLDSLTKARSEYTMFYEKQLSEVNSMLNNLLAQRDKMDIDGYSKLTPTINRLIESKESFVSKYDIFMIEINYQIAKLELKLDNAAKQKFIGNK